MRGSTAANLYEFVPVYGEEFSLCRSQILAGRDECSAAANPVGGGAIGGKRCESLERRDGGVRGLGDQDLR